MTIVARMLTLSGTAFPATWRIPMARASAPASSWCTTRMA